MRNLVILSLLGVAGGSIAVRAAVVEVVAAFEGNRGPGWKAAANVHGAVGPNHIVDFTVAGFTVHDKATGKVLRHLSQREFWNKVEPPSSIDPQKDPNDPWMLYDPLSQRWFATVSGTSDPDSFLAVSTSSDPLQAWKGVKLPLPRIDPGVKIGVDRNGLYICSANGSSDMKEALHCFVIPKADAIAPEGPVLSRAQTFPKLIYAAVSAVDLDPNKAADAPAVLLNNEFGGPTCGKLYLYKITWSGLKASLSAAQEIALSKAYPVPRMEGLQPPPGIRLVQAGGRRNNCAFVHGGSVFGCNGAKRTPTSRPGILWYEVRIRDGALLQEGFVDDPNYDYLYPSMAVDNKGNLGIGCTRTSEKEFPSVCVMTRAAGDPAGTMRAPVVAVKGTTYFRYTGVTAMNFSNYSTTCIDPSAPDLLWTYQGYANSPVDRQWCTAWAAFRMATAEKAPAPELTTIPVAAGSRPQAIVSGPDGAVWFGTLTKVCKIGPDRKISEIPLPDNLKRPSGAPRATIVQYLVVGPDRNLWGAYNQGNAIWSMSLSGKFAVFPVPTPRAWPRNFALGPDGNLWFTELEGHKIGKITRKGDITEFPIPSERCGPHSIVAGPDGALWFTEYNLHKIGRITTKGDITEFSTPEHGEVGPGGPRCICLGTDGALWFTQWRANKIGRMTMKGEVTEFDIPTPKSGAIGIAAGPDGNIWFCENKGGKIGRLSPAGKVTEYRVAEDGEPFLIIAGPDGNMWFTDEKDRIGHIRIQAGEKLPKKR
jgi:streptogramin lyase